MEVFFKRKYEKFNTVYHKDHNNLPVLVNEKTNEGEIDIWSGDLNVVTGRISGTAKHPMFDYLKSSNTEENFVKEFGNPMCTVHLERVTLVVEGDDTKVSIKLFQYMKHRDVGKPYFRKQSQVKFITYKFDKNDLFFGQITNGFKKKKYSSSVRRNFFASNPFASIEVAFHNVFSPYKKDSEDSAKEILSQALNVFVSKIPNIDVMSGYNWDEIFYLNFLKNRNIKVPNNCLVFRHTIPLPSKRVLKKTGGKLLDSYMLNKGFNGDKLRKVLHEVSFINDQFYKQVENFFGEKFLKHQSTESLKNIFEFKSGYQMPGDIETLTDLEKKNAFKVFEGMIKSTQNIQTFIDHVNFYVMLKPLEDIKWKSYDSMTFRREHEDWTDRYSHYTKGSYTRYYDEDFIKGVEQPIYNVNSIEYHPVVLLNSHQYNSESSRQHNCVKTYIDKASSLIVSFRENDIDSDERATIEYMIMKSGEKGFKLKRVQTLGRFNKSLDAKWDLVIEELDNRINSLVEKSFKLPKVKVDFKNQSIISESCFTSGNEWRTVEWVSPFLKNGLRPNYYNNGLDNLIEEFNF
jgi:hypothetical protein